MSVLYTVGRYTAGPLVRGLFRPFKDGLVIAFSVAMLMCLIAAAASWMRGGKYVHGQQSGEGDETGPFGAPQEPEPALAQSPEPEEWVPA